MTWDLGSAFASGHTTIWLNRTSGDWDYSFRFKILDRRCLAYGGSKSQCTYHYHHDG
jgi:hypothetical protein